MPHNVRKEFTCNEQKYEKYLMVSYSAIFIALAQVFKKFTAIKKLKNSCLFPCILKL